MRRLLAGAALAVLALTACGSPAVRLAAPVVAHPATTAVPMANPFDQLGYECYGAGDTVRCDAPGKPTIVKVDVYSPAQCALYARLVRAGELAAEVVDDPASPCQQAGR
jgi:hypothetical protein